MEASRDVKASADALTARTLGLVRLRLALLFALLALPALFAPGLAYAQNEGESGENAENGEPTEDGEAEDADEQAIEGDGGYEPDQRGYEPDQRGYEPDQRGAEGGGEGGGEDGGDQATGGDAGYEPDQRGAEESEPAPEMTDDAEEMRTQEISAGTAAYESGDYGAGFGLDLRLWLGASGTFLDAFDQDNLLRESQRGDPGGTFGITLGLRFGPMTVGLRHTVIVDGSVTLATFGVDLIVRLLAEQLTPYVRVGVGYALALGFADDLPSQGNAQGVLTELGVGFGGRVLGPMTLGAELSGGWLALYRGDVPDCEDPCSDATLDLTRSGQAHGLMLRGMIYVGFEM